MCWQVALYLKRKKRKKCLIVLCQMIATWSPNLLFPVIFLPFVNTGTSLSLSPQEPPVASGAVPSPKVLATTSPRAPLQFLLLWVKLKEHHCLPLIPCLSSKPDFCCNFFPMPLPKRWAAILGNWARHQLGGFKSNLKPISSCVGVQVSEALTPTPNLHGKRTVTPPPPSTALAFGVRCFLVHPEPLPPLPANPQPAIRVQTWASYPHSLPPSHTAPREC